MWPRFGPVPTYGVFYFSGIVCHFLIAYYLAKRFRLRHRVWITVSICYMMGMTVGAKALFDLQHSQLDFRSLFSAKHYMEGGLWGGLLAYFCLSVPLALLLSHRKRAALDLVAVSTPIPWIFAKLGCLFNGCCYGKACSMPWAITFPEGARGAPAGIPLHPTQIYEILVVFCIISVFLILKWRWGSGTMLLWFLILYGLGRAATEIWRGDIDHHLYIGPLTLSQLICLATAGISVLVLCLHRYSSRLTKPGKVLI
jgi:phosphatidylglycerol:prolipoprotein diacylglycerol transferase